MIASQMVDPWMVKMVLKMVAKFKQAQINDYFAILEQAKINGYIFFI